KSGHHPGDSHTDRVPAMAIHAFRPGVPPTFFIDTETEVPKVLWGTSVQAALSGIRFKGR
ncbi:MAG: hypothetical protein JSV42_13770, partial [Chloroflexota bacterium]